MRFFFSALRRRRRWSVHPADQMLAEKRQTGFLRGYQGFRRCWLGYSRTRTAGRVYENRSLIDESSSDRNNDGFFTVERMYR